MDTTIPTRTLGPLTVPAVGYGAMALVDGMYGAADAGQSLRTLRRGLDAGASFIDTSDAYGAGQNEELIGEAIAGRRDEVTVATKWGIVFTGGRPVPGHHHRQEIRVDADPSRAGAALDASLRRLGVDHVDLWYLHFPDPAVPIAEAVGAMAEQVAAGKVRHLGLSNVTAQQVVEARAVAPIAAVQAEWSLWTRGIEAELLPVLRELGIGVVAWSPLGAGFFGGGGAGAEDDFRVNHPRFDAANLQANRDRFAPLQDIADELEITTAQLALAWLLHADDHVVPIPGTRKAARVEENLAAAQVRLDAETLARIDRVAAPGVAAGDALLG